MKFKIENKIIRIDDVFEPINSNNSNILFNPKIINPMLDIRTIIDAFLFLIFIHFFFLIQFSQTCSCIKANG